MPTVRDVIARKGSEVVSVDPGATALDASRLMTDRGLGGLVVLDAGRLVGVFTERDVLRRVVAAGLAPDRTPVRDVMTADVITCLPDTSLDECAAIMTTRRVRHLPVSDERGLHGLVTIGDVLAFQVREHEATIQFMNAYMFDVR